MSIDLLLRALRRCRTKRLADKIHKKIVERFETTKVRRVYSPSTTVRCCNRNWFASVGSQFKCPLCGEGKLLLGVVR